MGNTPSKRPRPEEDTPPSPPGEGPFKRLRGLADLHKRSQWRVARKLFGVERDLSASGCVETSVSQCDQTHSVGSSSISSLGNLRDNQRVLGTPVRRETCVSQHDQTHDAESGSVNPLVEISDHSKVCMSHSLHHVPQTSDCGGSSSALNESTTEKGNSSNTSPLLPHYKAFHYSDCVLQKGCDGGSMSFSETVTLLDDPTIDNDVDIFALMDWADRNYYLHDEFNPELLFSEEVYQPAAASSESELDRILNKFNDDEDDEDCSDDDGAATDSLHEKVSKIIRTWTLEEKVEFNKVEKLLQSLKTVPGLSELPATARGLISSINPTSKVIDLDSGGQYFHFSIEKCLLVILKDIKGTHIELYINMDGISLFKSSRFELWPILGRIRNLKKVSHIVFPIGFHYLKGKPKTPEYLNYFVDELEKLVKEGLKVGEELFTISVNGVLCDAPAKAVVLGIIACNGKGSCTRCHVEGKWSAESNRTYFDEDDAAPRTHEEFLSQSDKHYHHFVTPLVRITSLRFPQSIGLDYMHLILLGVCRTLIYLWMLGKKPHRMGAAGRREAIFHSTLLASWAPKEFCRKPRSYDELSYFKATEWRQLLLYSGMVTFNYGRISASKYQHFLCLVVAMRILLDPKMILIQSWVLFARDLLRRFVQQFRTEYNEDFITHNLHNLLHICDDILEFGSIEDSSVFRFENFMQFLIPLVRKASGVLKQLQNRLEELFKNDLLFKQTTHHYFENAEFSIPHADGPLIEGVKNPQFKRLKLKFFEVTCSKGDNCCTVKGTSGEKVILIENFFKDSVTSKMKVVGRKFVERQSYFTSPCDSSLLGIYKVSCLSGLKVWDVEDIMCKNYLIPASKNSFVAVPLLNSDFTLD